MKKKRTLFGLALSGLILVATLVFQPLGSMVQHLVYDLSMQEQSVAQDSDILILGIDDASFAFFDRRWPWPREWFAQALDRLGELGAAVVGVDVSLSEKGFTTQEDEALALSMAQGPPTVLVSRFAMRGEDSNTPQLVEPIVLFQENSYAGFSNIISDGDGIVRNFDYIERVSPGSSLLVPSFPYAVYETFLGGQLPPEDHDDPYKDFNGSNALSSGGSNGEGLRMIDYRLLGMDKIPQASFHQLLDGSLGEEEINGKIILIGATYPESNDQIAIPGTRQTGRLAYGVELQAHALQNLIHGSFPKDWTREWGLFISLFLAIALGILIWTVPFHASLLIQGSLLLGSFLITLVFWNTSRLLLPLGSILVPFGSSLPLLVLWHYLVENRERRKLKSFFSRYVAPDVVEHLMKSDETPKLGGERRHVTVLFCDIVGFTGMSEKYQPETIVDLLNRYFKVMVDIIFHHGGTINKFIGDAIMAVFGAPIEEPMSEERAIRAAIEMTEMREIFNRNQRDRGALEIGTGIGISSGPVIVGNVGSDKQMDYTVIGDTVNLASRLEGLTRTLFADIVISDNVYQRTKDKINVRTPEPILIKGKTEPQRVHVLESLKL